MKKFLFVRFCLNMLIASCIASPAYGELRAGAAKVDVTPDQLPVLVNGGMTSRSAEEINTRVNARAIVFDDGNERLAVMVVDSCMLPRQLLDEAKQLAATRTQLKPDRILISATHTHTAPSSMGALGTDADPNYVPLLRQRLVEALVKAEANLAPARVGWGAGQAPQFTALRRWVRRPDRVAQDPFGNFTVRANMHSARNPEDAIGPTGPEDPELSMLVIQSLDGQPIAALANFSMHYFGDRAISADYFGLFCDGLEQHMSEQPSPSRSNASGLSPPPVAIMSHGCSGDIWKKDYMQSMPEAEGTIVEYSQGLLTIAVDVYAGIQFSDNADLAMQEARLPMRYRVPDKQRLLWAEQIVQEMGERLPKTTTEVYAREQILLDQLQSTEVVVQALRIGDIAIATTPNETYALTGLKLKYQSPLEKTMVIELANGGDGYIPPPEQHFLGGYNTWPARSAGLEVTAEPRIVAADLSLLEKVSGRPRRTFSQPLGPAAKKIMDLKPLAYWRLHEMSAVPALDATGAGRSAVYEPGIVFFLEGVDSNRFTSDEHANRCAHFAGGRLRAALPELDNDFSLIVSCWNGMPLDARDVAGWIFSRDYEYTTSPAGLHLGIAGNNGHKGCMVLQLGNSPPVYGRTPIDRWQWASLALVRSGQRVSVSFLGHKQPEIEFELPTAGQSQLPIAELFFGGRSDNQANWEGKLDEIAIFDRALQAAEIANF